MTKDWDIGHPAQYILCCKDTHSRATCPQNFLAIPRCSLSLYDGTMGDWPSLADQPFNNFIFLGRSSWHYFPGNVKAKKRPAVEEDGYTCDVTPRYVPVLTPRSQKCNHVAGITESGELRSFGQQPVSIRYRSRRGSIGMVLRTMSWL